ncbi:hypothetical protein RND61_15350 [Streptomyces sp. TRM76323]|uniref:Uncharacterized protein n=1 Tax=Streptomyces tamarix TaxID=3078565 RepID=A0ABU3QL10_9ACTN|nr:hypothetical protein [Streptomyces tamarix]MDT9683424.1 hypothetical protein [Streptomyces tamarix]
MELQEFYMYRDGYVTFRERPQYIIRQYTNAGQSWIFAYDISKPDYDAGKIIKRAYSEVSPKRIGGSAIADAIQQLVDKKPKVFKENPYIFYSPIVVGVSTITGYSGEGFYEKTPRKFNPLERKFEPSKPTGVFILLDDEKVITWIDDSPKLAKEKFPGTVLPHLNDGNIKINPDDNPFEVVGK